MERSLSSQKHLSQTRSEEVSHGDRDKQQSLPALMGWNVPAGGGGHQGDRVNSQQLVEDAERRCDVWGCLSPGAPGSRARDRSYILGCEDPKE